MKRLFFIAVILGTFLLTGIFAFSYWRLQNKTPQAYFERGKTHYDHGRLSAATIEFLNALKLDGGHRDSRFYLALAYIDQKDPSSGFRQLQALLDAHPEDVEANLQVGHLYLAASATNPKYYEDAEGAARTILAKDEKNLPALVLLGNALTGLKKFAQAVETLEKAIALDPKNVMAWISLGGTWVEQGRLFEAEKTFLKARDVDPKDKGALISVANFYRVIGSPEKAEAASAVALSQYPADRQIYSQVKDFYLSSRRFDDAERILRAAQAADGSDPAATVDLSRVYKLQKRDAEARSLLLDAKSKFPKSVPLSIELAGNLIPDKPDQARQEIDQILKAEPKNPAGHVLLGQLQFATGDFDAAAETLGKEPAVGSPYPQVHYLLGSVAFNKGKVDEALEHFQQSIEVEKNYLPALIARVNGFLAKGNLAEARLGTRQVLEIDPRNVTGRLMKAVIDAAEKAYPAAEAELSGLVMEFPNNPEVHRQMGLYWVSRSKTPAAEKSLSRTLEIAPTEQAFRDLTLLYLLTNQTDRARQKLNTVPDDKKQAFHYELTGMVAERENKPQESEFAYRKALEKEPNRLSTESLLFKQYLRTNRLNDAVKELDAIAKRMPSNAIVPAMKAAVKEMQGNSKEAEANYRKALEADPTIDFAANNLAYLLVQEGRDLQTAQSLAEGVRRRQPQNAEVADTLGWIYYKLDLPVLAKDQAEFAVAAQPGNPLFQYHLGEIYKKSSQSHKAVAALKKALASTQSFKEKDLAQASLKELQSAPPAKR